MATIHVDVVSAEEQIFSGEAKFVALPGENGELGILPRHIPLITRIKPGAVRIERADTAIRGKDLDEAKAAEAKRLAEEALRNAKTDIDIARAQSELAVHAAQIAALRK